MKLKSNTVFDCSIIDISKVHSDAGNITGRFSLIRAGSVITKYIPQFSAWYGNPAQLKSYITRRGVVLNKELIGKSKRLYKFQNEEPILT